jgi:hypothetical protein
MRTGCARVVLGCRSLLELKPRQIAPQLVEDQRDRGALAALGLHAKLAGLEVDVSPVQEPKLRPDRPTELGQFEVGVFRRETSHRESMPLLVSSEVATSSPSNRRAVLTLSGSVRPAGPQ